MPNRWTTGLAHPADPDELADLGVGANSLEVAVTSSRVALPSFASHAFATVPTVAGPGARWRKAGRNEHVGARPCAQHKRLWRDVWRMALFTLQARRGAAAHRAGRRLSDHPDRQHGRQVDELRMVQIRSTAAEAVRADPAFFDLPAEERNELIERRVQLDVERLRLDQPFIWRSFDYLEQAMRLDLGRAEHMHSDRGARDVYSIIVERLPATLLLFGTANFLIFFVSVFVALSLSRRYGSALDRSVIALAPSSAAPGWFYGIFLILIFAFLIPILPPGGLVDIPPPEGTLAYALSVLRHMALPVAAMFISTIFISIYSWRTFFLIHSSEDYVEMARAKGLPSRLIERRYILRPTLSPIITSFALMLIGLWSGAIILEQVFNWPGLGTLLFQAIGQRDTPVIIGSVVIFAYLLAVTVFVLDILYAVLDPRVRMWGRDDGDAAQILGRPPMSQWREGLRQLRATPPRWRGWRSSRCSSRSRSTPSSPSPTARRWTCGAAARRGGCIR
jgi:peptide/nickel transport system permease protein